MLHRSRVRVGQLPPRFPNAVMVAETDKLRSAGKRPRGSTTERNSFQHRLFCRVSWNTCSIHGFHLSHDPTRSASTESAGISQRAS